MVTHDPASRVARLAKFGIIKLTDYGEVSPGIYRERFDFQDGRRIDVDADLNALLRMRCRVTGVPHPLGGADARIEESDRVLSEALGVEVRS
jgi:hypothetical protein